MIELLWCDSTETYNNAIMCISDIIAWLLATISLDEKYRKVHINGYVVCKDADETKKVDTLLLCSEGQEQKLLLELLQTPPEKYSGKYVPCIVSREPDPVKEGQDDSICEDEDVDEKSKEKT